MGPASGILVLGYGNPGRLDDGLGPALAEQVAQLELPGVTADANYQLSVEDAAAVAEFGLVLFADASVDGAEPFFCKELTPKEGASFSTHHVTAEQVLFLSRSLFQADTRAYMLGIRGYEFNEFGERLCARAQENLDCAVQYVREVARKDWDFDATAACRSCS